MIKQTAAVLLTVALASNLAFAQQAPAEAKKSEDRPAATTAPTKKCRNISAEIRSGAPLTREIVIAEMVRARAEGEMDYYISSTPPAVYRPMCELPAQASAQPPTKTSK